MTLAMQASRRVSCGNWLNTVSPIGDAPFV